jgi:hypothetical protein
VSTQLRRAAALVREAGDGRRRLPRTPLLILGGFAVLDVAMLLATQALKSAQAPQKPDDLLARVEKRGAAEKEATPVQVGAPPASEEGGPVGQPSGGSRTADVPPGDVPLGDARPVDAAPGAAKEVRLSTHDSGPTAKHRSTRSPNADERAIDEDLSKAGYSSRPKIPGPGAAKAEPHESGPFVMGRAVDQKEAPSGPRKFGIPLGTHIPAQLVSTLDSRTISDAPVEARLVRAFYLGGEIKLPNRTMLYGEGSSSGGRFNIRFTRIVLPDRTEVPFSAVALDGDDRKPGLRASRTLTVAQPKGDGTATKVGKATAGVLLGQLPGDASGQVAQRAGQVVLDGDGSASSSGQSASLLDSGGRFDVFVKDAF